MTFCTDSEIAKNCARIFGGKKYASPNTSLWNGEKYNHPKKRVCFISGDFREHPVGYLSIGLIETFNKKDFETFGIFTGKGDGSNLWQRFCCGFDNFLNCSTKTDLEIARLIRSLEIDYLIDLSGYTADSRIGILGYRPAKLQITYLGFPGTLGLPYVDYLIADENTIPVKLHQDYSEKIISLPFNYLPRDNNVLPSEKIFSRADFGLPENGFVFCCFNHLYKITPTIFEILYRPRVVLK
jgi:predicted O-linked N-acetylglucosamine transferase (SPINDLY family)